VSQFSPLVNFEASFDKEFYTGTKNFVKKVVMGFNNVSKTGLKKKKAKASIRVAVTFVTQELHVRQL
jgi:hypothetical protein